MSRIAYLMQSHSPLLPHHHRRPKIYNSLQQFNIYRYVNKSSDRDSAKGGRDVKRAYIIIWATCPLTGLSALISAVRLRRITQEISAPLSSSLPSLPLTVPRPLLSSGMHLQPVCGISTYLSRHYIRGHHSYIGITPLHGFYCPALKLALSR